MFLVSDLQLPDDGYNSLKMLGVRFHDLFLLEKNNAVLEFAYENNLYIINSDNVKYVLKKFAGPHSIDSMKPEKANYTSILAAGSKNLKEYVEKNISVYIKKVFLALYDNSEESEAAIKTLINHEMIEDELRKEIISKQDHVFDTFEGIPENLWSHLLLEEKVAISWKNISAYLSYEANDKAVVTKLLGRQNIVDTLSNSNISIQDLGEDESLLLSKFVLNNDEINDHDYCKLINCLPYCYSDFPKQISEEKIKCLAEARKVILTEPSFSFVGNDNQLAATLISKNFDKFLEEKEKYPISDDVRRIPAIKRNK